ncbi:MAG: hypothetical protein UX43_C0001G0041 [Candidatus Giovannonibacteria bacterium GW2011_GWB1_46_20]|uniref:Capsule polysaccharide biosynthesis protein n=2 Tax=Candidatus Giovannoniibacteriota TaxID=1752738 RepID=A0A0G1ILW2_9BACT|nr:MAG: hypothetical protein UW15_C0022G0011 [Parcubacteria group bacterium GW2011_GWC1_44_10]KKT60411.1 MAG: hypothetical protein UW53_C0001G0061 [Candidatus Giovannonibacteria bacterium GW2011_GWA1_44_25]KKU30269.1 MAG: hypothetical protein UX43_C0001G0041 [Candidatus Giovannonibacteria bacterium GW2011_GWB1_46_20]
MTLTKSTPLSFIFLKLSSVRVAGPRVTMVFTFMLYMDITMKACLQLQRRFAYVGHAMAVVLKKRYGVKDFCGYVELTPSLEFLKSQKEIKYSDFLLESELRNGYKTEKLDRDYIQFLGKEYGLPNLWPYIEIDRTVRYGLYLRDYPHNTPPFTHEEMMRMLQSSAKKIIAFLDKEKPDFMLFAVINDFTNMLLYHIAKKKNIKTFFIQTARIRGKYSVTEKYGTLSFVENVFNQLQEKKFFLQEKRLEAETFLKKWREHPTTHSPVDAPSARPLSRKKQFNFLLPNKIINTVYWIAKNTIDYFRYKDRDYCKNPFYFLIDRARRKIRILVGFEVFYDEFDAKDDFAFYPLQYEPEMAVSLFAPFYTDQLWLAKQIARSLPIGYKFYIKEHPAMFGYRPRNFYRELKKIPNVKLIKPTITSFELIERAKIIITLTNTSAWEAVLLKKPAITFGNAFFNILPMVKNCKAIADLPYMVKEQLENFNYDEEALLNLLAAIFQESADLDLVQIWDIEGGSNMEKKKEAVAPFVDFLASKLNLMQI